LKLLLNLLHQKFDNKPIYFCVFSIGFNQVTIWLFTFSTWSVFFLIIIGYVFKSRNVYLQNQIGRNIIWLIFCLQN
jgi:hypothetical protein